jgi:hypothetical protein
VDQEAIMDAAAGITSNADAGTNPAADSNDADAPTANDASATESTTVQTTGCTPGYPETGCGDPVVDPSAPTDDEAARVAAQGVADEAAAASVSAQQEQEQQATEA